MSRSPFGTVLSSAVRRQIEARCAEFEHAWMAGSAPRMEDFLSGFSEAARPHLLRELLVVEIERRQAKDGGSVSEQLLLEAHPQLKAELKRAWREVRHLTTRQADVDEPTVRLSQAELDSERTIDHTPGRSASGGLQIRCPHCSNHVEVLAASAFEDINCSTCGSMFSLVDRDEIAEQSIPLKTIDRFDLVSRLGVGGFGTVWKARDRELDRMVAVKIPRRGQLGPAEVDQFFREARAAAQLRHPNIVPVHEVGREGDTLFIVSDFIRGAALSDWLVDNRASTLEVAELCATIADALHHAHQKGVVHRDLKPHNIMMDEADQPHVMDFGLAKREVGEITMTVDGQVLGTPAYMSPEQAKGQGHWTDRRTDIYSLGMIIYEMLTGELPFRGNAQMQMHQRLTEDPPDPRRLNRFIPRDLATICLKCLEREPGRRYGTAADLSAELNRYLRGEPIFARPISGPERVVRWTKRNPLLATIAGLVAFLAVAGPATALVIAGKNAQLETRHAENSRLINRLTAGKEADDHKIAELTEKLNVWTGQANPWDFWPPYASELPRQTLTRELLDHASRSLVAKLQGIEGSSASVAAGYLGLAILADTLKRMPQAVEFYESARDQLIGLEAQEKQDPRISLALAECYTSLARLTVPENRELASRYQQAAREIHEQLAKAHPTDADRQIAWMESEVYSATLAGFDAGKNHVTRASGIHRALPANWPNDPVELYRLACFVTQREAVLAAPVADAGQ